MRQEDRNKVIPYDVFEKRKAERDRILKQAKEDLQTGWERLTFSKSHGQSLESTISILQAEYLAYTKCGYLLSLETLGIHPTTDLTNLAVSNLERAQDLSSPTAAVSADNFLRFMQAQFIEDFETYQAIDPSRAKLPLTLAQACQRGIISIQRYLVRTYP